MRWGREPAVMAETGGRVRRGRGERGTAIITASVLLFALTAGGILYLTRDVNRGVTNRSAAQSIAFQAARAGAQQIDVGSLRGPRTDERAADVAIDADAAEAEVRSIGDRLLSAYGLDGSISDPVVDGDAVTVSVTVIDEYGEQTASATVRAQTGP